MVFSPEQDTSMMPFTPGPGVKGIIGRGGSRNSSKGGGSGPEFFECVCVCGWGLGWGGGVVRVQVHGN